MGPVGPALDGVLSLLLFHIVFLSLSEVVWRTV